VARALVETPKKTMSVPQDKSKKQRVDLSSVVHQFKASCSSLEKSLNNARGTLRDLSGFDGSNALKDEEKRSVDALVESIADIEQMLTHFKDSYSVHLIASVLTDLKIRTDAIVAIATELRNQTNSDNKKNSFNVVTIHFRSLSNGIKLMIQLRDNLVATHLLDQDQYVCSSFLGVCRGCYYVDDNVDLGTLRTLEARRRYQQGIQAYTASENSRKACHVGATMLAALGTVLATISASTSSAYPRTKTVFAIAAAVVSGLGGFLTQCGGIIEKDIEADLPHLPDIEIV
jgi:hypothetical protein